MMEEKEEQARRRRRKEAYHLVAGHSKLPRDPKELEDDQLYNSLLSLRQPKQGLGPELRRLKASLLEELAASGGDVRTSRFQQALAQLTDMYDPSQFDARVKTSRGDTTHLGGMWINLSSPNFPGCIGHNHESEPLYSLGQMSFDMFRPTELVCSIQGTFNPVHYLGKRDREAIQNVPRSLKEELKKEKTLLRTYKCVSNRIGYVVL